MLGDLRTTVQRDLEADEALPSTLEADLFGYLEELQRLAAARKASAPYAGTAPTEPPPAATPPTDPT